MMNITCGPPAYTVPAPAESKTHKTKKLIIFGTGDLAQIAYEYFTTDSNYEVVAFTVDREYIPAESDQRLLGLPILPFDTIETLFHPHDHEIYVAMVYNNMNRDREAVCQHVWIKGYDLASYISSHAFVSPSAKIGEHCFIMEDNTIQPYAEIRKNCILWSGNHVGHHSIIGNNVFISSHVVISGHCEIGDNCFIGVNSTLANNTSIGKECWISHGSVISGDIPSNFMVKPTPNIEISPLNEEALARSLKRAAQKAKK